IRQWIGHDRADAADTAYLIRAIPLPIQSRAADQRHFNGHATASYRGVGWSRHQTVQGPIGLMITDVPGPNGVLYRNSQTRIADVSDGLSSTLFAGEVCLEKDNWGGIWAGANRKDQYGLWIGGVYWAVDEGPFRLNGPDKWAFRSMHPG